MFLLVVVLNDQTLNKMCSFVGSTVFPGKFDLENIVSDVLHGSQTVNRELTPPVSDDFDSEVMTGCLVCKHRAMVKCEARGARRV